MLHAYIDESGERGHGNLASDHFVLSASVVRDSNFDNIEVTLASLRTDLNRAAGSYVAWKNIRSHSQRLHIARTLGRQGWMKVVSVVACKRHLFVGQLNESQMYLYQLRFLLERLSWMGRKHREVVSYTVAHIIRFKLSDLREYETKLRGMPTEIDWRWLDPAGGTIDQPQRLEPLQLADLVASATGAAFNADSFGNVETRYLIELGPRLYRQSPDSAVTSYGLKCTRGRERQRPHIHG